MIFLKSIIPVEKLSEIVFKNFQFLFIFISIFIIICITLSVVHIFYFIQISQFIFEQRNYFPFKIFSVFGMAYSLFPLTSVECLPQDNRRVPNPYSGETVIADKTLKITENKKRNMM